MKLTKDQLEKIVDLAVPVYGRATELEAYATDDWDDCAQSDGVNELIAECEELLNYLKEIK